VNAFNRALLDLDLLAARRILDTVGGGTLSARMLESLVVPALVRLGDAWERGDVALSQVYMSGRMCEHLIDSLDFENVQTSEHDRRLVAGIIALAAPVNVGVTAEGVEHSDQAAILHEMGCPAALGYLYSAAVPVDLMTPLLDHTYPLA
jgi:hypothetical protein